MFHNIKGILKLLIDGLIPAGDTIKDRCSLEAKPLSDSFPLQPSHIVNHVLVVYPKFAVDE
jgi:hypothetical protein